MSDLAFPDITETVAQAPAVAPTIAAAKTTAIADSISAVHGEVAKFDQIAAGLRSIEAAHPKDVIVADIATSAGMKVAETGWRAYRNPRLEVERARKAAKAPVLALGKAIDTFAGDLETRLRDGEDHYKAQIDAEDSRRAAEKAEAARIEAERIAKHRAGIAKISAYLTRCQEPGMTADRISIGIGMLEGVTFGPEWEEFAVPAANAQCETLEVMRALHARAVEREAEAARLEAQRIEQARQAAEIAEAQAAMRADMARIARLTAMIAEIRAAATGHEHATSADLLEARIAVAALDTSEAVYQELAPLAHASQLGAMAVLDKFHADACAREEAAQLAEAQRRAEVERVLSIPLPLTIPDEPSEAAPVGGDAPAAAGALPFGITERLEAAMSAVLDACVPASAVYDTRKPDPTMTLGEFNAYIAPLKIDGAGLESLGFPAAGRRKAAMLYHDTDKASMVAAMVLHLQGL